MAILAILSVVGGWIAIPGLYNQLEAWLSPTFHRYPTAGPRLEAQPFYWQSMAVTLIVTALGVVIAYQVYYRRSPSPEKVAAMAPSLYRFMAHRYFVDELYHYTFSYPIRYASTAINLYFERYIVDGAVDGAGLFVRWVSNRTHGIQTGYVRNYALGILFGAVLLVGYYVVGGR
jgi:NADH-quinone oxidoreductase subunit L